MLQNPPGVDILPDLIKWMKKAVFVREDIVACSLDWAVRNNVTCIGAPFEADWQLRQLEIDGIIDAILTIDGDLIALGCSKVIFDWDQNKENGDCNIVIKEDLLQLLNLGEDDFRHLCIFLGTDYISRAPHRKRYQTLYQWILNEWSCWSDVKRIEYLDELSIKYPHTNYAVKFAVNDNIWSFAPVFKIAAHYPTDSSWTAFKSVTKDFDVDLKPLLDLPDYQTKWESFISFDPFQIYSYWGLENVDQYKSYCQMLSWAALDTERPPSKIPKPFDIDANSYVPHGAILDFELVPIHFQFLDALVLWLRFRGVNVPTKIGDNRQEIMQLVHLALQVHCPIDVNAVDSSIGIGHYVTFDKLVTINSIAWFTFDEAVYAGTILDVVRNRLLPIGNSFIDRIFGPLRNGVRWRALRASKSGNYILDSIKMARAISNEGAQQKEYFVFAIDVVPSLKAGNYQVYIVVDEKTGDYVGSPYSRCTCPAGQMFCSHMLGFYLVLYSFQRRDKWMAVDFMMLFPEPVKLIQTIPLLISEAMLANKAAKMDKESKRKKK